MAMKTTTTNKQIERRWKKIKKKHEKAVNKNRKYTILSTTFAGSSQTNLKQK